MTFVGKDMHCTLQGQTMLCFYDLLHSSSLMKSEQDSRNNIEQIKQLF